MEDTVMKKISNYEQYKNILPYSSEMFGVYQPLIGWKSKRIVSRLENSLQINNTHLLDLLTRHFSSNLTFSDVNFKSCTLGELQHKEVDFIKAGTLSEQHSLLSQELQKSLNNYTPKTAKDWQRFFSEHDIKKILDVTVFPAHEQAYQRSCEISSQLSAQRGENDKQLISRIQQIKETQYQQLIAKLQYESIIGKILTELTEGRATSVLDKIFYRDLKYTGKETFWQVIKNYSDFKDPYLTFDPKKDIDNVSLSPLGIVHLFRQYFFEFDTFLGSPTGHVWLAPGSTVELIEVSTRKTIIEKTYETSYESITKTETSTTEQDEISTAVKEDNK